MLRSILHCDMNNFYASVECMLDPALKKYPIPVCGSVEERHGIVLAKNYKANQGKRILFTQSICGNVSTVRE